MPVSESCTTIGRSTQNDLVLSGDAVSRKHAVISFNQEQYWLEDLSTSGTLLNNEPISEKICLKAKDEIQIFNWTLVFQPDGQKQRKTKDNKKTQVTELLDQQSFDGTRILKFDGKQPSVRIIRPTLIVEEPLTGKRKYSCRKSFVSIGSDPKSDIFLEDDYVSGKHAELHLSDQGFLLKDLKSTNGTLVKEAKIQECYLQNADVIKIGRCTVMVCFDEQELKEITPFAGEVFCGMIGKSESMRLLFSRIQMVAGTGMTVLIQGQTGTGKELVSRAIHDLSPRNEKPYVVLNCAAISSQLIESELFGHEKGAFTGAEQQRVGAFERADGGTIFLDEIGELPLELQAKILRVLEYNKFMRVGGSKEITVNIRLIAATHRDLHAMVQEGAFRQDLFYRLYVLPLNVPALNDRGEDVLELAEQFLGQLSDKPVGMNESARRKLLAHDWPGNVRELRNAMMRALVFCGENSISAEHIELISMDEDFSLELPSVEPDSIAELLDVTKEDVEREEITAALEKAEGDKNLAANLLKMGRSTLFRKIKLLGIKLNDPE